MLNNDLLLMLRNLKLYGMAETFTELNQQPGFSQLTKESLLSELAKAEIADRKARSINYQMGIAKFPLYRDIDSFNFDSSEVNEEQILTLHEGHFITSKLNLYFTGGDGTGKTLPFIAMPSEA